MYELFKSNKQDESLLLLQERIPSLREAMKLIRECKEPHCQIEQYYDGYHLVATKHHNKITKYY